MNKVVDDIFLNDLGLNVTPMLINVYTPIFENVQGDVMKGVAIRKKNILYQ